MVPSLPQLTQHIRNRYSRLYSISLAIGLFACVSTVVGLCVKHAASKILKKHRAPHHAKDTELTTFHDLIIRSSGPPNSPPRSPMATPKKILTTITSKAFSPFTNKDKEDAIGECFDEGEGTFGEGGVWQKSILMGDRCRPLEFSGVIYYDDQGNRIPELPRSPRLTPRPGSALLGPI